MAQTIAKARRIEVPATPPPVMLLALCVAACWPVWIWCVERTRDGSDDPMGVIALLAAVLFSCGTRIKAISLQRGLAVAACLLVYAVTAAYMPMLIRAGFAVTAIAILLSERRINIALWGLLLLSLPVVATMQFYLGYPMRLAVAHAVAAVVGFAHYPVQISGTDLIWESRIIGIDPACSGIRMLWTAFFICFVSACIHKLDNRRTALLVVATIGIAIFGNIFRACMLFMLEVFKAHTGTVPPDFLHAGIGVVLFGFVVAAIVVLASRLAAVNVVQGQPLVHSATQELNADRRSDAALAPTAAGSWIVLAAIVVTFFAPHSMPEQNRSPVAAPMPVSFEGHALKPVELSQQEKTFAAAFPGQIGKFTDGTKQYIIRIVAHPTRQLHPAEDCFRGIGYKTHALPNVRDAKSNNWGCFEASNEEMKLNVRERITDNAGNSWTDVSSWYWSAILGKTHGPWQAVTIAKCM